mmetsp:Transcript_40613/g.105432  ORF Transcript_40613/g.105432 Transcript_40613/m.105432 type:complete len:101 (-) Transcript_40613:189-491(-)
MEKSASSEAIANEEFEVLDEESPASSAKEVESVTASTSGIGEVTESSETLEVQEAPAAEAEDLSASLVESFAVDAEVVNESESAAKEDAKKPKKRNKRKI